jgi:hypothetical protein
MALEHLLTGLLECATNEQGSKSVVKALKEGLTASYSACASRRRGTLPFLPSLCLTDTDPSLSARRAMIVDLALSLTGSQLIASVLLPVRLLSPDLQNLILWFLCRHIVTLRGCKTGSNVIWLLYVHPTQFLLYLF